MKGPREMKVYIPIIENKIFKTINRNSIKDNKSDTIMLINKPPVWSVSNNN